MGDIFTERICQLILEEDEVEKEFGQLIVLPPFKGRIHPDFNRPEFVSAISDCDRLLNEASTKILLDSRNRVGVVNLPLRGHENTEIVIKEFRLQGVDKLKSIFLPSKAFKAWQGGMALVEREIKTPLPVAFLEKRKSIFLDQSFFLSVMVNGIDEIRFLFRRLHSEELYKLLEELAEYLSLCHKKGILHRDLSDGNILVKKDEKNRFSFFLIDTNRSRVKKRVGFLRGVKNLIRLGIPRKYQHFFLEQYLRKPHVNRFLWLWYKINKTQYTWFIKFKKALRLRQISQKLKIQ